MSLAAILEEFSTRGSARPDPGDVHSRFESWVADQLLLELYPAQEEALLALALGEHVILATPTGTGKSLVALGAHFSALAAGGRTVYTAPIKALVNEKFFALVDAFGPELVGMVTGDSSINPDAPIICCTAEILANLALRDAEAGGVTQVVMDEFHYYADPERGWAWQVPLLTMPRAQFLLMSATLGDVTELSADIERRTGRAVTEVTGVERPVPLSFAYELKTVHEAVERLREERLTPAYLVHFNQSHAVEQAQALASVKLVDREGRDEIAEALGDFKFATGFGQTLSRLVRSGIGVHHAGMLPRYRRLVEQLAQRGLLRVICGTDTLGVGINVPIRSVVFTALTKFDGEKMRRLSAREFHQIAGRAGRAGFDTEGDVIALAPEHEVENAKQSAKTLAKAASGKKVGKGPKKKAPPAGFVTWSEQTLEKLVASQPEPLVSRMRITHSMVLSVIARGEQRPGEALDTMRALIFDSHEPRAAQYRHARTALGIFRTLRQGGIVETVPFGAPDSYEPLDPSPFDKHATHVLQLTVDLQQNFALNQPLSPFALAAIELLDPESESYALDVISIVEATLEDPRAILRAQEHKARGEAVQEMKAEGIEYDERMERLEEITHPQPLKELIDEAFEAYTREVPWARDYEPRPKSVVREMVERAFGFRDFVSAHDLGRAEGTVLRYLSDAFRAIERTVPEPAKTDELNALVDWLGELVRQVDSSLLDEWNAAQTLEHDADDGVLDATLAAAAAHRAHEDLAPPVRAVTENERAFTVMVRNAVFKRVLAAAFDRVEELGELDGPHGFGEGEWDAALERYYDEYDSMGSGAAARSVGLLTIDRSASASGTWRFRQVLDDPAGDHDWAIEGVVDLAASAEVGDAVIVVERVGAKA